MIKKAIRKRTNKSENDKGKEVKMESTNSKANVLRDPLLPIGSNEIQSNQINIPKVSPDFWDARKLEYVRCTYFLSQFFAQLARRIANIVINLGSFLRKLFSSNFSNQRSKKDEEYSIVLSPLQEERWRILRQRLEIPFDVSSVDHQSALKQLWSLAYPDREIPPLKSDLWKEMGWQNSDPSTDFRGGGFISLENLIYFAKTYPDSFHRILHKIDGERSEWEYPFSVAGVNISYMLTQMLDLQSGKLSSKAGVRFLKILGVDESAFDNLFCIAFQLLDSLWLAKQATYMEFNMVLKSTRIQLEQELVRKEVSCIQDMPSYNLLK